MGDLRFRVTLTFQTIVAFSNVCPEAEYSLSETFSRVNKKKIIIAQRGARIHDPEIKSLMLYRLS